MKLYYCSECRCVAAFDLNQIRKHNLITPEDTACHVCYSKHTYMELEIPNDNN